MLYVTTSWDDGHACDRKLADMLDSHGVKGTFYISKMYPAIGAMLTENDIRVIARRHEIGAHTLTHPDLTKLEQVQIEKEIAGSKEWLESTAGNDVKMFCYPSGIYDERSIGAVKKAGFVGARTIVWPSISFTANAFEMETSLPVYPLPFRKLAGNRLWWRKLLQPLFERYGRLRLLRVPPWCMRSWQCAARAAFDHAYAHGDTFHLWGHSWELENYGMWGELDSFLAYITSKPNIQFVTNSELLTITQQQTVLLGQGSYGSWLTSPVKLNKESIVYSFGVGEDVSWDIAMIEKFGMQVCAFDPSPRSVAWVDARGPQQNWKFYPYGLSDHDGLDEFYPPPNPKNVSFSTVRKIGIPERFPVKRLRTIMQELGHDHIDVLKMDIEGSEYDVIEDILASKLNIPQLLVEFHDRFAGKGKTLKMVKKLRQVGYKVLHVSSGGDEYTFVKI